MSSPRSLLVACGLCVVVFTGLQLAWLDAPCGTSLDADIAAGYTLYSCRAAEAVPFAVHRGHWSLLARAEDAAFVPYLHHPPLGLWLAEAAHALHASLAALRAMALLLACGVLWALWAALRHEAPWRAGLGVGLCAGSGAFLAFGSGASPPLFGMAFALAALVTWQRGAIKLYWIWVLAAGLSDWNAYGMVPALWWGVWQQRSATPWRLTVQATVPWIVAALLVAGHMLLGAEEAGGLGRVLANVSASLGLQDRSIAQLLGALGGECVDIYGWPLCSAAMCGGVLLFVRAAREQLCSADRFALQCWIFGLVPCAVFLSRAATHPFWVIILAPAFALSAATLLEAVLQGRAVWRAVLASTVLAGALVGGVATATALQTARATAVQEQRARLMETLIEDGDILLFSDYSNAFAARALTRRTVVVRMESLDMLRRAARALRNGATPRRITFVHPLAAAQQLQWLMLMPKLVRRESVRIVRWPGAEDVLVVDLDPETFLALAG